MKDLLGCDPIPSLHPNLKGLTLCFVSTVLLFPIPATWTPSGNLLEMQSYEWECTYCSFTLLLEKPRDWSHLQGLLCSLLFREMKQCKWKPQWNTTIPPWVIKMLSITARRWGLEWTVGALILQLEWKLKQALEHAGLRDCSSVPKHSPNMHKVLCSNPSTINKTTNYFIWK